MSILTRLSATIIAGVDKTVSQIENHDAIIDASIKDSRHALARAKVRLQRVQKDGATLRNKINENERQVEHWSRRAKSSHTENQELALACMQRRKSVLKELENNRTALTRHDGIEAQVSDTIAGLEKRLKEITEQRNQMRTRESAAEAQRIINRLDSYDSGSIEDTFDRWDIMISESEMSSGSSFEAATTDPLEAQFTDEEDKAELQAELDELLGSDENREKNDE